MPIRLVTPIRYTALSGAGAGTMGDAPRTYKDGHQFHNTQALEFLKERFTAEERATEAAAARRSSGQEVLGPRNKKSNIFFLDTARQRTWASDTFKEHDVRRGPIAGVVNSAAGQGAHQTSRRHRCPRGRQGPRSS